MAINKKAFTAVKTGQDLIAPNLMAAIDEGFVVMGKGPEGIDFHMSVNDKAYFLMGLEEYQKKVVFVSAAVAEKTNNVIDLINGDFPIRSFSYPEVDQVTKVPTGETRECYMACAKSDPNNAKYVSAGAAIAANKAAKATLLAEATLLAQTAGATPALQTANATAPIGG